MTTPDAVRRIIRNRDIRNRDRETGAVQAMALLLMAVLFAGSMYFFSLARQTVQASADTADKFQAELDASSGMEMTIFYGATGHFILGRIENTSLNEEMPDVPSYLKLTGAEEQLTDTIFARITDSRATIGTLGYQLPAQSERFLEAHDVDDDTAKRVRDCLGDWLDTNDLRSLNGEEDDWYTRIERRGYGPRNMPMLMSPDEAGLACGLDDPAIFALLRPYLSPFWVGLNNINTMGVDMIQAVLDVDEDKARQITAYRDKYGALPLEMVATLSGRTYADVSDMVSYAPGRRVVAEVEARVGGTRERIRAALDFRAKDSAPVTIVEYVD